MTARSLFAVTSVFMAAACGARPSSEAFTAIDSTGDTVVVRIRGEVPEKLIHHLVEELRIAPTAADTTLFTNVSEYVVDAQGRMWVFDSPTSSVLLFGPEGKLLRRFGRKGGGPGEFQQNNGMVALDTGLAVLDYQNGRISFFSDAGLLRSSWTVTSGFFTSAGLIGDRSGALRLRRPVTPPREGEFLGRMGLVRVDNSGKLSDSLAPPDLQVQREVYLAVSKDGGARTSSTSSFAPNYHWGWHPDGFFVVGHGGRYEIVLQRPGITPLAIRRDLPPVPIEDTEQAEEHDWITWSMRRTDPTWSWNGPPLPKAKAPLLGLRLTRDGRVWAQVAVPSQRIPEDQIDPPRDPRQPIRHFRTPPVYEVFAVDGSFLGRIEFPLRSRLMEANGNLVWVIGRDENDLPAVIRYRIEPGWRHNPAS